MSQWRSQDFSKGRPQRGSDATERGRVWRGGGVSHGREIFEICV